jgi:hypothetical protein
MLISDINERQNYIDSGCDEFDWYNEGTKEADRRAAHEAEVANITKKISNVYRDKAKWCGT